MSWDRGVDRYQSRDGDTEYIRLSQQISNNIFAVQGQVKALNKISAVVGTRRETPRTLSQMKQLIDETTEQIKSTTSMIKRMGDFDGGSAAEKRSRDLEQKKFHKDLQVVAQSFKQAYKTAVAREQETVNRERAESSAGGDPYGDEKQSLIDEERGRQQFLAQEVDYKSAMIHEREEGIKGLESQMVEVNDIFKDIASIVQEQGDMLDTIETNMTTTYDRVDSGVEQLTRASRYQKQARGKAMCLLVIVVVIAAILTVIILTSTKKKK